MKHQSELHGSADKAIDPAQQRRLYWNLQEIFKFHQKRGNDEKYNFRLKNYPCQKLMANHAYGQIAQIAHNLLRWVAFLLEPEKPHFAILR